MMLRAFGLFVLVFAVLSLVVHLNDMGELFATGALFPFAIEVAMEHFAKGSRPTRMRGEPLL
jgi:hypothetical protein